ncbi:MAG: propanediol dehydratase, partial [Epulopiscium sp.]|nr:propanediol dehydratase [Candidatus Epulonipiscium sp.]
VQGGYDDVADSVLQMLKQRITGDYLHTSSILTEDFEVISAINDANDYQGPGTGYRLSKERWEEIKNIPHIIERKEFSS